MFISLTPITSAMLCYVHVGFLASVFDVLRIASLCLCQYLVKPLATLTYTLTNEKPECVTLTAFVLVSA